MNPDTRKPAKKPAVKKTAAKRSPARAATRRSTGTAARRTPPTASPRLLSGGNPQIPKGEGDAPVQAYIAAMPGWKRAMGSRLDALIACHVRGVRKAVKWNSPLYGMEPGHWFLGLHVFTHYIKVAFFRGAVLKPLPPGKSKQPLVRYLDIREEVPLDEAQFIDWVKQASRLPGEKM
jgi:hypothetical protein